MAARSQRSHYELLDVELDAKREAIALAYQRALEVLAREHNTDPDARAALRKAFEVLSDPVQRMSYDLSARLRTSATSAQGGGGSGHDEDDSIISRVWGNPVAKGIVAAVILIAIVMWMKTGKASDDNISPVAASSAATTPTTSQSSERDSGPDRAAATRSEPKPAAATGPRSAEDIFNQVSQSVVRINVSNADGARVATGSGVVIGPGSVITNCHVALRGDSLEVKLGGVGYIATVEVSNEDRDLCLLSVSGLTAPAVSLGSVDSVRVGQRVYAVGAPQGLDLTISDGIVSALRESQGSKMIQTSAPVSPGSSGGGLFDTSGRMIGVVTFQTKVGQNLNFAVPADWVGEMRTR